jgi:hypothetical protein
MKTLLIIQLSILSSIIGAAQNIDIDNEISNILNEAKNIRVLAYNGSVDQSTRSINPNYFAIDTVLNKMIYAIKTDIDFEQGGSITQVYIKEDKILKVILTFINKEGILKTTSYWIDGKIDIENGLYVGDKLYSEYLANPVNSGNENYFILEDLPFHHDKKFTKEMVAIIEHCRKQKLRIDSFLINEIKN